MALSPEDRDIAVRTALAESSDPAVQARIVRDIVSSDDPSGFALARARYKSWDDPRSQSKIDAGSATYQKVAQLVDKTTASDASAPNPGSLLELFGHGSAAKTTAGPEPGSLLKLFGSDTSQPSQPAAQPVEPGRQSPETGIPAPITTAAPPAPGPRYGSLPYIGAPLDAAARYAAELPGRIGPAITRQFTGARELAGSGAADIRGAHYFPTMPSADPSTWTGGGLLKTAAGIAGMPLSVVSGPLDVGAEDVNRLTGAPGTGEKAAFLLPGPKFMSTAANTVRPGTHALNRLVEDIGPENIPKVYNRLQSNPSLAIMDVAPGVQSRTMSIASGAPSAGQTKLFEEADKRVAERRAQTGSAFESTIGPAPNTVELLDKMKADARKVGTDQIQPALAAASPVDVSPVISAIDAKLKPGITAVASPGTTVAHGPVQDRLAEIRQELTDGQSVVTDPARLHELQSELARESRDLATSATGSDKRTGYAVANIRNQLVDAIDSAAGGKYKPGLAAYRDEMDVQRAFDRGQSITSGARTGQPGLENRPEAWEKWVNDPSTTPKELEAARLGARVVIDNHLGTIRQAGRAGGDIPDAPFTRAKLEMLFGKPETDRLVQLLADEKAKAETNTLLTRQSKTARTQATQRETAPRTVEPAREYANRLALPIAADIMQSTQTGLPGLMTGGLLALGGAIKGGRKIGNALDIARNNAYAHIASTRDPAERQILMNALAARASLSRPALGGVPGKAVNALSVATPLAAPYIQPQP